MTRDVRPRAAWTVLIVAALMTGALAADASGAAGVDGRSVVPAELAQAALAEALRFADVTYEHEGIERQGVAYLLGGRISVERYVDAIAQGKAPGVDVGIDASGLVVQAYLAADPAFRFVSRPGGESLLVRDASSTALYQWNVRTVPVEQLRPGDLIFFQNEGGRVAGVGIFERREGPNVHYIVASANAGRVIKTFNNVNNDYWRTRFLAAGQLLWSVP